MTVTTINEAEARAGFGWSSKQLVAMSLFCLAVTFALARPVLPEWMVVREEVGLFPYAVWLDAIFNFVKDDLGLLYLTRAITGGLEYLLDATANLLYGKRRWPYLGPIPWTALAAATTVIGYYLGGWRLALIGAGTFLWTALIGQWEIAMQTMSVIAVAVPAAFLLGLGLGIAAWKSRSFEAVLKPVLAILQTLPFFTYLLPAVIFFKVGPTAGAVATTVYAMPPMILMTTLGLRKVPPEVVEAGKMAGCTRWQMLRHVYLPSARTEILVGVNQVFMLCLAMVVLTAFIGMPGLGGKLLAMMNSFKLGRSFEIGVTIVLFAVMLDRFSKAWVAKQPEHFERGTPWWQRHLYMLACFGSFTLFIVIAFLARDLPDVPLDAVGDPEAEGGFLGYVGGILDEVGRTQSLTQGRAIDDAIKAFLDIDSVQATTEWLRWFLNVWVLIPFRNALLWLPIPTVLLAIASVGYLVGGLRSALIGAGFFALIATTGWWDRAIITLYTVISAVILATLIGLPMAVWASRSERWSRRILLFCDTAQTFPSFIYLIPAIMLFGVNDVAVVFSILIFTLVPLTRYTIEGLRSVPVELTEAADMAGATRRQKLWNVQLPLALPTMAVGFNQAIMFAFFMVIIAAFIGTQDLGQELQRTLAGTDLGKNFVLGMCVSLMALVFDHIIMQWSNDRRKALGVG